MRTAIDHAVVDPKIGAMNTPGSCEEITGRLAGIGAKELSQRISKLETILTQRGAL